MPHSQGRFPTAYERFSFVRKRRVRRVKSSDDQERGRGLVRDHGSRTKEGRIPTCIAASSHHKIALRCGCGCGKESVEIGGRLLRSRMP